MTEPTQTESTLTETDVNEELETDLFDKIETANKIVNRNVCWALGAGVTPITGLDMLAIGSVQLKMIKELSDLYGVPYSKSIALKAMGLIVGAIGPIELSKGLSASITKLLPGAGTVLGAASLPVSSGVVTYVIGHVFAKHFETGGNFFTFDASKAKENVTGLYAKAKNIVPKLKKKETETALPAPA